MGLVRGMSQKINAYKIFSGKLVKILTFLKTCVRTLSYYNYTFKSYYISLCDWDYLFLNTLIKYFSLYLIFF
jgi:hypothetical protein